MDKLLSIEEVASYLKVSQQHVRTLCRDGKLLGEKVGKQWVTTQKDLDDYIKNYNVVIEPDDHPRKSDEIPDFVALSFFSGAMGLDIGLEKEGIEPLLASEIDKETRKTIQANNPDIALIGDLAKYNAKQILEYARIPKGTSIDLIFGGPPCQAFSTAGKRKAFEDDRGNIFLNFIHLIGEMKPKYALIENVRGLLSAKYPIEEFGEPVKGGALFYVVNLLKRYGYSVSFELYNSANFGAPQVRERIILLCKLGKKKVPYLTPTHSNCTETHLKPWVTLGEALEGIEDKEQHHVDFPEKRLKYFRLLKQGQNWRNLPEDIQPEAMGKSFGLGGGKTGFYRRLSFDKPSPTLVTHPAMPATDLCHPIEDRPLSIEEYRRIQGFPDDWKFCGKITDIYKQIGNAVPIELGRAVGRTILADDRGEQLPIYPGFKYSRYKNTNETDFMSQIEIQKKNEQLELVF
ncbi:DNA cytosine methyltransferase [Enterococcus hulanensis]|nr:DNA cytosine methyltransferase [Enterococcus hulanensis]MBO0409496.1 DNA cytosine methyltransferase [Enterococcus hulanensis]